jgi:large subunit ribosomal protein L23
MRRDPHTILLRPTLSEKAVARSEEGRRVILDVAGDANKVEIRKAVEAVFSVKVAKVNTVNIKGKAKRLGKFTGRRSDRKRAIVTLAAGQTLNLLEQ